jgi:tape measure domain-containing protein
LTGSADEAERIIEQIKKDAVSTPFDVSSLTQAESLLISTGLSADEARQDILALGDVVSASSGGNAELQRMAVNLQQIKNVGKASALDIKQFAYAGIDIYGLLADSMGVTREEASKLDVTYEMLSDAFGKASKEGGKYYKAMEKQSKTLSGASDNLKESFNQMAGELSKGLFEVLKELIPKLTEFFNWISENKEVVLALGGAILVLVNAITLMFIISKVNALITAFSVVVGVATGTIGICVVAIAAVVAAFIYLYTKCEWFRDGVSAVFEVLKVIWQTAFDFIYNTFFAPFISQVVKIVDKILWLKDKFIEVKDKIVEKWKEITQPFKDIFDGIKEAFKSVINWIIDKFNWFIRQVNKIQFPDWDFLGPLAGKGFNFDELQRLNTGTNYVPQDMVAMIHEGEAVVPKKFNPYANNMSPSMVGTMTGGNNIVINVENNMEFDALGQLVNNIKTFSGGAKNDYNYGMGGR